MKTDNHEFTDQILGEVATKVLVPIKHEELEGVAYYIDKVGRIVSCNRSIPRVVEPATGRYDYPWVVLNTAQGWRSYPVPELMLRTFTTPPKKASQSIVVCRDGNTRNLKLENWEWSSEKNRIGTQKNSKKSPDTAEQNGVSFKSLKDDSNKVTVADLDLLNNLFDTLRPFLTFVPEQLDAFHANGEQVVETNRHTNNHSVLLKRHFEFLRRAVEDVPKKFKKEQVSPK